MPFKKVSLWLKASTTTDKLSSKLEVYGFVHSYSDYSLFTYKKGHIFLSYLFMLMISYLPEMTLLLVNNSKSILISIFGLKILAL